MVMDNKSSNSVALVVGSGSVLCAASLGLQRVLRREGIEIDRVVGCSGGSIYAAMAALGHDVETSQELTLNLWTREVTRKRMLGLDSCKLFGKIEIGSVAG
jgi:NTE family protein